MNRRTPCTGRALLVALAVASSAPALAEEPALARVEVAFAHDLSTPNGVVPLTWPSLAYDRAHAEVFVVAEGFVRIFDAAGMETHRFGDDGSLGQVSRVAILETGQLIVLTRLGGKRAVFLCDFRGEPIEELKLTGLPAGLEGFDPDQLVHHGGKLYFAERGSMRVVVTDLAGAFRHAYALRALVAAAVKADSERRPASNMDAFNVDGQGNLLFTMSTMFAGGVVSPAGQLRLFGSRGSRAGKFNIIGGIDADERGYVYVTDRLRSVVSVWDRELRHLEDFGYRGGGPTNLLTPYELAVGNGEVFVAQAGKRGVKAFRVRVVEPEAPPRPGAPKPPAPAPPPPPEPPSPPAGQRGVG